MGWEPSQNYTPGKPAWNWVPDKATGGTPLNPPETKLTKENYGSLFNPVMPNASPEQIAWGQAPGGVDFGGMTWEDMSNAGVDPFGAFAQMLYPYNTGGGVGTGGALTAPNSPGGSSGGGNSGGGSSGGGGGGGGGVTGQGPVAGYNPLAAAQNKQAAFDQGMSQLQQLMRMLGLNVGGLGATFSPVTPPDFMALAQKAIQQQLGQAQQKQSEEAAATGGAGSRDLAYRQSLLDQAAGQAYAGVAQNAAQQQFAAQLQAKQLEYQYALAQFKNLIMPLITSVMGGAFKP